jgi:hypothetical protein
LAGIVDVDDQVLDARRVVFQLASAPLLVIRIAIQGERVESGVGHGVLEMRQNLSGGEYTFLYLSDKGRGCLKLARCLLIRY